jgi:hypothetical protein
MLVKGNTMSAAIYDMSIDQGSDFAVEFQISEDEVFRDLTVFFVRSQIRASKSASSIAATFTCNVSNALEGKFEVVLLNSESKNLRAGEYFYDIELYTAGDATVNRIIKGTITVSQEVTR